MSMTEPTASSVEIADARTAALGGLIDYAGLFPPAALGMPDAVAGYRRARSGDHSFVLGRFVCPAARLEELAGELIPSMTADESPWSLVVLAARDADVPEALLAADGRGVTDFQTALGAAAVIEAVDVCLDPSDDRTTVAALAGEVARLGARELFFEVPFGPDWREAVPVLLAEIEAAREQPGPVLGAKIRCGGLTTELFPSAARVALFVATCRDLDLPFKATAGLHHPFRHCDAATGFRHHGFVNLVTATVLGAIHGLDAAALTVILDDEEIGNFRMSRRLVGWRSLEAGPAGVTAARRSVFTGYGSCDFDEPVADLVELGVLPVENPT